MGRRPFYIGKGFEIKPRVVQRIVFGRRKKEKQHQEGARNSDDLLRVAIQASTSSKKGIVGGGGGGDTVATKRQKICTKTGGDGAMLVQDHDGGSTSTTEQEEVQPTITTLPIGVLAHVVSFAVSCPMNLFHLSTINHKFYETITVGVDQAKLFHPYGVDPGTRAVLSRTLDVGTGRYRHHVSSSSSSLSTVDSEKDRGSLAVSPLFGLHGEFYSTRYKDYNEFSNPDDFATEECLRKLASYWDNHHPKRHRYLKSALEEEAKWIASWSKEQKAKLLYPMARPPDYHRHESQPVLFFNTENILGAADCDNHKVGMSFPCWLVYVTNRILRPRGYMVEGQMGFDDDSAGWTSADGGYGVLEMRESCLFIHLSESCQDGSEFLVEPGLLEYLSASGLVPLYATKGEGRRAGKGGDVQPYLMVDVPNHTREFLEDAWWERNYYYRDRILKWRFCKEYETSVRPGLGLDDIMARIVKSRASTSCPAIGASSNAGKTEACSHSQLI